jgi:hypothetical protein
MPDQASQDAALTVGFKTPFQEQLDFFRKKLNLPTAVWDDIMRSAHDRAFIVAGAAKADLLQDLRGAMDRAMASGAGLDAFRKDFKDVVAKHGWTGWTGWTGEGTAAGEAWRTKVIYQTNMATSYAAGRYRQLTEPAFLALRPYWKYVHNDSVMHPRPLHLAWNGLVLRHDDPFWSAHFPPNGWGCRCRVTPVGRPMDGDLTTPPAGWDAIDPKTGAPAGVDRGFDYAPGASTTMPLRQMVQDKLITYPDAMAKALSVDVNKTVKVGPAAEYVTRVLTEKTATEPLWLGFVESFERITPLVGTDVKGYTVVVPADAPRHVMAHHSNDGKDQRPPVPADFERLLSVLNDPDKLAAGEDGPKGQKRVLVLKQFGSELLRCIFEVRPGKANRSLALVSLVIKLLKK